MLDPANTHSPSFLLTKEAQSIASNNVLDSFEKNRLCSSQGVLFPSSNLVSAPCSFRFGKICDRTPVFLCLFYATSLCTQDFCSLCRCF